METDAGQAESCTKGKTGGKQESKVGDRGNSNSTEHFEKNQPNKQRKILKPILGEEHSRGGLVSVCVSLH